MNLRVVIPTVIAILAVVVAVLLAAALVAEREQTLNKAWQTLKTREYIDLTHAFNPDIPHWSGFPPETPTTLFDYLPGNGTLGSGFFSQSYTHVGQWGTHVDAPSHFVEGLRSIDQIGLHEMVLPLVVLDVHEQVERGIPTYTVTLEDVRAWEGRHGPRDGDQPRRLCPRNLRPLDRPLPGRASDQPRPCTRDGGARGGRVSETGRGLWVPGTGLRNPSLIPILAPTGQKR